jgi:hypothetical protein
MSLRVNNCPASESEWQKILKSLFQQEPLPDIQATATVQSEKSISITLRKEIQGITVRLVTFWNSGLCLTARSNALVQSL